MEISIGTYQSKHADKKCSECEKIIPAGDKMLNIILSDTLLDHDDICNIEHDIILCPKCAREAMVDDELDVIRMLIGDLE